MLNGVPRRYSLPADGGLPDMVIPATTEPLDVIRVPHDVPHNMKDLQTMSLLITSISRNVVLTCCQVEK